MGPDLLALSQRYMGENPVRSDILVGKVNCEKNQNLCFDFQVRAYPDLSLFMKGSIDANHKFYGDRSLNGMSLWIESIVGPEEKKVEPPQADEIVTNNPEPQNDQPPPQDAQPQVEPQNNGDKRPESDLDMNQLGGTGMKEPDPEPNLLDIAIASDTMNQDNDNKPDASLAAIKSLIADAGKKDEDPLENLNFKQRDILEKVDVRIDNLQNAVVEMAKKFVDSVEEFKQSKKDIQSLTNHIERLTRLLDNTGGGNEKKEEKEVKEETPNPTKQANNIHETHISISQALLFITIGTMVGVGLTFAYVNFRKLKKKKYLVD